ncbi:MAG: polyprenyl synthetase family protein [Methanobacteriota archaeon]|nr:MAG: polyprenyl synthetase family protein [Euryarchaeota archaeon]
MTSGPVFDVEKELSLVEECIQQAIRSDESLLTDIARYVVGAGGKRIRPTVALLANKAVGGKNVARAVQIAATIELIHSATLLHDDINDGGALRRGKEAAYKKYGVQNALVAGDFMFVKAFAIGGTFEPDIVDLTARVCTSLAEAEIVQKRHSGNLSITRDEYLDIVRRKTALPISAGARIGAILGGGTPEEVEALASYGLHVGTAFQIVDDILDVVGDPAVIGKPVGTDLKEGNMTLLVLHALNDGSERRAELSSIIRQSGKADPLISRGLALIRESGAVERARVDAEHYGFLAREALDGVRPGPYRDQLSRLADFVVRRNT